MWPTGGQGREALIIGNGGSVDSLPWSFWESCRERNVVLVGTNRALCLEALREVKLDAVVIRDTYRDLWHRQEFGEQYHQELWKPAGCWKVGPADRRYTFCDQYVRQVRGWQSERTLDHNGEAAVMRNSSVVLMAANWAWLIGCRRLYLIGVDYGGSHAQMVKPFGSAAIGWAGQYDQPVPDGIERQFAVARDSICEGGGSIWNLSELTRLEAIEPMSWQEVMRCE